MIFFTKRRFKIKKIGKRGEIFIWIVDGEKIRNKLDINFTNFGQHFRFSFIPKYEFWLDKEANPNEQCFFIDHLLVEWKLMKEGTSYDNALEIANKKERSERFKAGDFKKVDDSDGVPDIEKIHSYLLGTTHNGITVWLVYGRLVRSVLNVDFTEGGHDLVYSFVPKNEVWIDDDLLKKEIPYVILHELYE
ncbi:hypothetical protein KKA24_03405, partial [Patescibacteria group bacterium]|nr:hypothetical protein [Patescibacteria group bacterium]